VRGEFQIADEISDAPRTGSISGTPEAAGTDTVIVQVSGKNGASVSKSLAIKVA
jgi:hypothetical protein